MYPCNRFLSYGFYISGRETYIAGRETYIAGRAMYIASRAIQIPHTNTYNSIRTINRKYQADTITDVRLKNYTKHSNIIVL